MKPPVPATGISQGLEIRHPYQPDTDSISAESISQESISQVSISQVAGQSQSSIKGASTPSTIVTDQEMAKKRKDR